MLRLSAGFVFAIASGIAPETAAGAAPAVSPSCRAQLDARLPGWRLSPPPPQLKALAANRHEVTNVIAGDFDDDGAADTALLVTSGSPWIAVCLARASEDRLFLIEEPYGRDGISLTRKGTRDHDYETGRMVRYRTDGVHAYTFEKSGATYLFRRGRWIRVVDSD